MFCTVLKYLVGLYLLSSYKTLPGVYFVRFYYYAVKNIIVYPHLFSGRNDKRNRRLTSDKLGSFAQSKLSTYASFLECDLYFHKNNATYFEELDISRCDLMTAIFQKMFIGGERKNWPYVPVANVFTNFLMEIKPMDHYDVLSSIFCWDEKWIYVLSRFKKGEILCSLSLTKYVLKDGRKTIPPTEALKYCGYYNEVAQEMSDNNLHLLTEQCGFHETTPLEEFNFNQFPFI